MYQACFLIYSVLHLFRLKYAISTLLIYELSLYLFKSNQFICRTVTNGIVLPPWLDLSSLKYRERDDLESTFRFWTDSQKQFPVEKLWYMTSVILATFKVLGLIDY
jgi:hypothetical protein